VVDHVSDHIGVMYLGRLCEVAPARQLFRRPRHPYTRLLLDTIPDLTLSGRERTPVAGEVPSPIHPPPGCAFHPRCPFANGRCRSEIPALRPAAGVLVACHAVEEDRLPETVRSPASSSAGLAPARP
jgi:peptide/nickel transport system ATP-binding protein